MGSLPDLHYFNDFNTLAGSAASAFPGSARRYAAPVNASQWLMDTGSGYDLVELSMVRDREERCYEPPCHIALGTANGQLIFDRALQLYIPKLREKTDALVLPSTPAVLSVGRRCMEGGYSSYWGAAQMPFMLDKNGRKIQLFVGNFIPYLDLTHVAVPVVDLGSKGDLWQCQCLPISGSRWVPHQVCTSSEQAQECDTNAV